TRAGRPPAERRRPPGRGTWHHLTRGEAAPARAAGCPSTAAGPPPADDAWEPHHGGSAPLGRCVPCSTQPLEERLQCTPTPSRHAPGAGALATARSRSW